MLVFFRFVRHNVLLRHSSNSSVVILNVRAHSESSFLSVSVNSKLMVFSSKRSTHAFRNSTFLYITGVMTGENLGRTRRER